MSHDFSNFLRERMREKGLSLKKLSDASGISPAHLEALLRGHPEELPPAPYLRGYLRRLGEILDFEPEEWWAGFKQEAELSRSGGLDRLPRNRFARQSGSRYFWLLGLVLVLLLYLGFRFTQVFGKPVLTVDYPAAETTHTAEQALVLRGKVSGGDELKVNGESVVLGEDGSWQKEILLQSGLNPLEIKAGKFLGGETSVRRQVIYEPVAASTSPETATSTQPFIPPAP